MKTNKALELFRELFERASVNPGPILPTYFVPRDVFINEVKNAGIDHPTSDDAVSWWDWEKSIGMSEFAHKLFKEYHKAHGTDFTPMEKGQWRLHQKMRKQQSI